MLQFGSFAFSLIFKMLSVKCSRLGGRDMACHLFLAGEVTWFGVQGFLFPFWSSSGEWGKSEPTPGLEHCLGRPLGGRRRESPRSLRQSAGERTLDWVGRWGVLKW